MDHVSLAGFLVILLAGITGATVQGLVGFGLNLICVPVVALIVPEAIPSTLIVWAVPFVLAMAIRERHGVDWSGVRWMTVGRIPGTVVGLWVVSSIGANALSLLAGVAVLVAVSTSLLRATLPLTPATKTATGFASSVMGTSTSIGGPPMALLYQHQDGQVLRATLSAAFFIGTVVSVTGLTAAGEVEGWHVVLAAALTPGLALGLFISKQLAGRLDARWLRPCVLGFAALAGVTTVLRALV